MGKRYYCDFCDKTFPDNPPSRKKHLYGIQHQILVKSHYDHFKDPATRLEEELQKTPCKRFARTRDCHFGSNCRFSHFSHADFDALRAEIEHHKFASAAKKRRRPRGETDFSLDDWLAKREKRPKTEPEKAAQKAREDDEVMFTLPPSLQTVPNLPPSLLPPPPGGYELSETAEWGW